MGAPSSEQEAREIAAEMEKRPNLQAVTAALLAYADTLPSGDKRTNILTACSVLDVGLAPGADLSDGERADWMKAIGEGS